MRVPVLRELSLGEVLDTALGIYRQLFSSLLFLSVVTQCVPLAVGVYVETAGGVVEEPALWMLSVGLALVLGAVGTSASTFMIAETYLGSTMSPQDALLRSTPFLGRLIGTTILVSLLMGVGAIFLLVPGIIVACGLYLTTPALVLEDIPGGTAALSRSWHLTRGFRLRIFGALMVAFTLLFIPAIAVSALAVGVTGSDVAETTVGVAVLLVTSALQILAYPFFYALATVFYYDLRVRKEGFDLQRLAASMHPA